MNGKSVTLKTEWAREKVFQFSCCHGTRQVHQEAPLCKEIAAAGQTFQNSWTAPAVPSR